MAEKRFIDANGSYTLVATDNTGYGLCFGGGIISVINWHGSVVAEFYADDAPAADVVEVVRCKDCTHGQYQRGRGYLCEYDKKLRHGRNFCSDGEQIKDQIEDGFCPYCGAKMDGEKKERDNDNNQT